MTNGKFESELSDADRSFRDNFHRVPLAVCAAAAFYGLKLIAAAIVRAATIKANKD
jgi:hypothetical protein